MKWKAFASIAAAGTLWGTISIFIDKLSAFGLGSLQIVFFRATVAAISLVLYAVVTDRSLLRVRIKDLWVFVGTGIVSFIFFNYCYFTSIRLSSVSVAAALLYTAPVFVMLFSTVLFKEKLSAQKVVAVIATVTGCLLLSGMSAGKGGGATAGIVWGIASGLLYGLYSIFGQYGILKGYKSLTITTYTFIFAAIASLFMVDVPATLSAALSFNGILWVLLIGIMNCTIPYLLYTKGLSQVSPSAASVMATIEPAVACVVGIVYFSETVSIIKLLGIILILSAVVLLNVKAKRK